MKYGNPNFLETSGPLQACKGTVLPFYSPFTVQTSIQNSPKVSHNFQAGLSAAVTMKLSTYVLFITLQNKTAKRFIFNF